MADRKRKSTEPHKNGANKIKKGKKGRKKTGPHLPNALRKELDINPNLHNSDEEIDSDEIHDLYEYEEAVAEEDSKKNRRYDPGDNIEYELPEKFEDENVASDDEVFDDDDDGEDGANQTLDDIEEEDGGRHVRMLQGITGLPVDMFEGKKRRKDVVISEAYPESKYNPSRDVLDGGGHISINDLLVPLQGKRGFSKLRANVQRMERNPTSTHAPLPKPVREKIERLSTYQISNKDMSKWAPLIKKNREASTIYFNDDIDLGYSTVGAIASEFQPRNDFEMKMNSLVNDSEVKDAYYKDGARLLELNKISVEDVKDRQDRLAKMRNLLFRHEIKAKRIKKIKSKTYHRLLKKDRLKGSVGDIEMDPEAAKELAMKQEYERAKERLTQKHKNTSQWAQRIIQRGLSRQDDGTRAAISEQLNQHALLTRKMNSMKDGSSSDDSSEEDDDLSDDSDEEGAALKLLEKAKEKTLKVLGDDEMPEKGVLSLPFMVKGLKKRKQEADEEAKRALDEYELSLKQLDGKTEAESLKTGNSSGRRVFGAPKKHIQDSSTRIKQSDYANTDSEDDFEVQDNDNSALENGKRNYMHKDVNVDPDLFREESEIGHDQLFKSFDDIVKNPGPKTSYEVALFTSNSSKKKKNLPEQEHMEKGKQLVKNVKNSSQASEQLEEVEDESDNSDDEPQMIDGILTSGTKSTYELPSQTDLIRRAFAGDDVEDDFEKNKLEMLNDENPEPEKPVLLPGWGQWTNIQKKRGLPSWILDEHANAKKKREEALKKRKDALLKHVIISEKVDKKAEKLHTKTLPFPYTSNDVFEQSIRMPIGPEFNPATVIGALNRPEVVKKAGVIIKPIKFKEVSSHERKEEHKRKKSGAKPSVMTKRKAIKC